MQRLMTLFLLTFALSSFTQAQGIQIMLHTNKGDITVTLDQEKAPKTVANFLNYVDDGFYDGTIFHRVIKDFMIQGGGLMPNLSKKETLDPVENEAKNGLKNTRGSIAMARTSDPHSATAQFFINLQDNGFLDYPGQDGWGYAVFGQVTDGMEVVDSIATSQTGFQSGRGDVPVETVLIESIKRVE